MREMHRDLREYIHIFPVLSSAEAVQSRLSAKNGTAYIHRMLSCAVYV